MLKLILIFVFACSFFYSSSEPTLFWWWIVKQQECFLFSCGLTHNICFQFDRFWNTNSWERKWWLHDGLEVNSLEKSSTYPSNLSPHSPNCSKAPYFTSFTSTPLSSVGLTPNKVTSSCIVGEIVKFSLSPCGSDLAVISSNCDCNTETGWNRLASYFSSGSLWAYLNI